MSGRVMQMFDRIADGYDRANRMMSLGLDTRWRRLAVANLLGETTGDAATVLDLCAGTLDSTLVIHERYPQARVIAGDFAAKMLARGRQKLSGAAAERIETQVMDAQDLPLRNHSLDAIFCAFGVRNLPDLRGATSEQARCLKPGGRLVVLDFFRPQRAAARLAHAAYNRTLVPLIGWAATGDREAYQYLPRSIDDFERVPDYAELLRGCGFENVTTEALAMGVVYIVRARRAAP